jgi:4,5-DOPA dioxygenase extradiol
MDIPKSLKSDTEKLMPVLFIGHGSPMNAIEDNEFSKGWQEVVKKVPKPKAILCISAHWETKGTQVTAMKSPKTIHDFGGFPKELYEVQYPAPGSGWLAGQVKSTIKKSEVLFNEDWGLDHGCWSVLRRMFPKADIPVTQLSLDHTKPAGYHYELAKELLELRKKDILIIGSGNLVHNLFMISVRNNNINEYFGFEWAFEANNLFKKLIIEKDYNSLTNYKSLGESVQLAIPTPEHYLPMIYAIALIQKNEVISFFNDKPVAGSITMTSFIINK